MRRSATRLLSLGLALAAVTLAVAAFADEAPEARLRDVWARRYGVRGPRIAERAFSLASSPDGGFLLGGVGATADLPEAADLYLVKTDAIGIEQWSRHIGNARVDEAIDLQRTRDGGYIIVGSTNSQVACGGGLDDGCTGNLWLLKVDANANVQWMRQLGGDEISLGRSVIEAENGDYVVTGARWRSLWVLRFDRSGDLLWETAIDSPYGASGRELVEAPTGELYVVGFITDLPPPKDRFVDQVLIVKLDQTGSRKWDQRIGYRARALSVDRSENGIAVAGVVVQDQREVLCVFRMDSDGRVLWERTYGAGIGAVLRRVDGGFIILSGTSCGSDTTSLLKIEDDGDPVWHACYRGARAGYAVLPMDDGTYVIAGDTRDSGLDFFLGKVRSDFFVRGELDDSAGVTISDAVALLRGLFSGAPIPCLDAGDIDDSGTLNVTDAVALLMHLFTGGSPPAEPRLECGQDESRDGLTCDAHPRCH